MIIKGYNHLYKAVDGPVARAKQMGGLAFENQYEVQNRAPKLSNSAVRNLIQISPKATGTAMLEYDAALTFVAVLSPSNLYSESKVHADPYWAIYTGTADVAANQIFPHPGSSAADREYEIRSGFDLGTNNNTDWNGINGVHCVTIEKLSAGSVALYASVQWNYIIDNAGTIS